ncbi:hypothetical protein CA14_010023 [Aspergillus flavus]|uniref:Arrestin-like N-terminal domain-containing protein n=1 Tax=Aspergillus flavus TaxID=5059 RepID=A0AB74C098_ASPFL|nr:hypothetical protein CA14_010023 [Aspergillus flavus]
MAAIVERRSGPRVTVNLDDPKDGIVNRYTTGDEINFNVTVTVREDVMIGALQITFEGTSETTIEPPGAIIKRTAATHSFLSFPFTFVLPYRLLPQACDHETSNWVLKDAHVRLPPTLGDSVFLDRQQTMPDDFAPNACRVSYIVKVSIPKAASDDDSQFSSRVLAAVGKEVHIIPTVDEEPPLSAQEESVEYRPWAETLIRRGLFEITTG